MGPVDVGDARFDYVSTVVHWFDRWLKDEPTALDGMPRVQYYVLNSGRWQSSGTWPDPAAHPLRFYLRSGGHANSRLGDGRLSDEAPGDNEAKDAFSYDPKFPVPSLGGNCCSRRSSTNSCPSRAAPTC